MARVPNTDTFKLTDVVNAVGIQSNFTLSNCFASADPDLFDSRYAIGSDNLGANRYMSEFRNYGYYRLIGDLAYTLTISGNMIFMKNGEGNSFFGITHDKNSSSRTDELRHYLLGSNGTIVRSSNYVTINKRVTDLEVVNSNTILVTYKWLSGSMYYFRVDSYSWSGTDFTLNNYFEYGGVPDGQYDDSKLAYWNGYMYLLLKNSSFGYVKRLEWREINTSTGIIGPYGGAQDIGSGEAEDIYCQDGYLFTTVGITAYIYAYKLDDIHGTLTYANYIATTNLFKVLDGDKKKAIIGTYSGGTDCVEWDKDLGTKGEFINRNGNGITGGAFDICYSEKNNLISTISETYYILEGFENNYNLRYEDSEQVLYDAWGGSTKEQFTPDSVISNFTDYDFGVVAGFADRPLGSTYYYLFSYPIT